MNNDEKCYCNCGYACGGPGHCELFDKPGLEGMTECIEKHFERDCGHDFKGPLKKVSDNCRSMCCQKCGMSALAHDEWVGP